MADGGFDPDAHWSARLPHTCTARIWGVSTCSHRACMTRSIKSSNAVSDGSAMCVASRRISSRAAGPSMRTAVPEM